MADPYSFVETTREPPDFDRVSGPVGAAISSGSARAAQLELAQAREQRAQEQDAVQNSLNIHRAAMSDAKAYYDLAKDLTEMQTQSNQRLDAADFLSVMNEVNHNDPEFETKIAALSSRYPLALGDPAVQKTLDLKKAARETYKGALQHGGAYEFEENSPAHHKFVDVFQETRDMNQARAAAAAVKAGEEQVRKHVEAGYLTPEDIYTDTEKNVVRPELHDERGYLNYTKLNDLAARKAGATTGKPLTQEQKEIRYKRDFVLKYKDLNQADEPDMYNVVQLYKKDLNEYEMKQRGLTDPADVTATQKSVRNLMNFP